MAWTVDLRPGAGAGDERAAAAVRHAATPAECRFAGSILFALFLIGWGLSFLWGPIADRFGRARAWPATILVFSVFTGAAALAQNVWQLGLFRFLAGIGIGGEWAMAGTYVAEAWPEDRRKQGAGYLQTGYYAGFFLAAALNYTVGDDIRLARHVPVRRRSRAGVVVHPGAGATSRSAGEGACARRHAIRPLAMIFSAPISAAPSSTRRWSSIAIIGLWAGSVYEPTALITLATKGGMDAKDAHPHGLARHGDPFHRHHPGMPVAAGIAERIGRKRTLALLFRRHGGGHRRGLRLGLLSGGWLAAVRHSFLSWVFGGNFALFSLWLPEQYPTPKCAPRLLPSAHRSAVFWARGSISRWPRGCSVWDARHACCADGLGVRARDCWWCR